MRIVFEPEEFAEIVYFKSPIDSIFRNTNICPESNLSEGPIVLYCPMKIIYYPESYNNIKFKLPVFISLLVSLRRVLKYYSNHYTFLIRNIESNECHQFCFYDYEPLLNKKQQAKLDKGIERAQNYPDDKLGYNDASSKDDLCWDLCNGSISYGFDIFTHSRPPILVTGRYEIYFTRFGLESNHCFIDIVVDYTEIKE